MTALSPQVKAFLATQPLSMFVDGQWIQASSGATLETRDPGTNELLSTVAAGGAADVDRAMRAAHRAFESSGWASMPANQRAVLLHRLADAIERHAEVLCQIESLDVGKPIVQARAFDVPHAAQTLRWYADLSVHARRDEPIAVAGKEARSLRQPCGVCGFIFPWNFPFLLLAWGIAPALAAGNTVVIKPAEDAPLSTLYLCRLAEEAGLPPGVINVVTGLGEDAGAALARHPLLARMSFTGSPEVGRLVAEACGRNLVPVKLELGGKGAAVIFEDASVDDVAAALAGAVTLNAGQVCCTATRWLVHESLEKAFVEKAIGIMAGMKVGYGAAEDTAIGPLISEKQRQRVLGYLRNGTSQGARVLLEGGTAHVAGCERGFFVKPALLTGSPDNVCARDEIFGPVAYLMTFRAEEEAVTLVNQSRYGLANSVWSADLSRANRVAERLVAGTSWINSHNVFANGVPYGGVNLSGCGGGVLGADTLEDYRRRQSILRPLS